MAHSGCKNVRSLPVCLLAELAERAFLSAQARAAAGSYERGWLFRLHLPSNHLNSMTHRRHPLLRGPCVLCARPPGARERLRDPQRRPETYGQSRSPLPSCFLQHPGPLDCRSPIPQSGFHTAIGLGGGFAEGRGAMGGRAGSTLIGRASGRGEEGPGGNYVTLAERVRCETEVKRSRFIACAAPIGSEAEALAFLDEASWAELPGF
jgi:hypothetical protein